MGRKVAYAFNESNSPVSTLSPTQRIAHESKQFMGYIKFDDVHFEFDPKKNYAPKLVLEGNVDTLEALDPGNPDCLFPNDVSAVYFSENKPRVRFENGLTNEQLANLARKGFWDENGVVIGQALTTTQFMLEVDATVFELKDAEKNGGAPVLSCRVEHPYQNYFDINQIPDYDLTKGNLIKAKEPDMSAQYTEGKEINLYGTDIVSEVEALKQEEARKQKEAAELAAAEKAARLQDPETIHVLETASAVGEYVDKVYAEREAAIAANAAIQENLRAEQAEAHDKLLAEQAEAARAEAAKNAERIQVEVKNQNTDDNEKLVHDDRDAADQAESAAALSQTSSGVSSKALELAARLQANKSGAEESKSDKNDNSSNNSSSDNNSNAGSQGAQTDNNYTFANNEAEITADKIAKGVTDGISNEAMSDYKNKDDEEEKARRKREKERKARDAEQKAKEAAAGTLNVPEQPVASDKTTQLGE